MNLNIQVHVLYCFKDLFRYKPNRNVAPKNSINLQLKQKKILHLKTVTEPTTVRRALVTHIPTVVVSIAQV